MQRLSQGCIVVVLLALGCGRTSTTRPPPEATLAPGCSDSLKNFAETDVDCGGPDCLPCAETRACRAHTDCASGQCDGSQLCTAATCADGKFNGLETDVDCGGGDCPRCRFTQRCLSTDDCQEGVCLDGVCEAPSCADGLQNGTESDPDCGGAHCAPCALQARCIAGTDCASGLCTQGRCAAQNRCLDGRWNGDETDVDCGGSCGPCQSGRRCAANADCRSGVCTQFLYWSDNQWRYEIEAGPDWWDLSFDDSKWALASELAGYGDEPWGAVTSFPPDSKARWVWHSAEVGEESAVYFRRTVVAPSVPLELTLTAQPSFSAFLDGTYLTGGQDWKTPERRTVKLAPGRRFTVAVQSRVEPAQGQSGLLLDLRTAVSVCRPPL